MSDLTRFGIGDTFDSSFFSELGFVPLALCVEIFVGVGPKKNVERVG